MHSAPALRRLHQQMYLRIMFQRLIMSHADNRRRYRFFICNAALVERNVHSEPLSNNAFQHLKLYLTHKADVYLFKLLRPCYAKLRVLFLKPAQLSQRGRDIRALGENELVTQNGLHYRRARFGSSAQTLPRKGPCEPCHRAHRPR